MLAGSHLAEMRVYDMKLENKRAVKILGVPAQPHDERLPIPWGWEGLFPCGRYDWCVTSAVLTLEEMRGDSGIRRRVRRVRGYEVHLAVILGYVI